MISSDITNSHICDITAASALLIIDFQYFHKLYFIIILYDLLNLICYNFKKEGKSNLPLRVINNTILTLDKFDNKDIIQIFWAAHVQKCFFRIRNLLFF